LAMRYADAAHGEGVELELGKVGVDNYAFGRKGADVGVVF
jgi:hypothetical protein